jgi:hypothetical protein
MRKELIKRVLAEWRREFPRKPKPQQRQKRSIWADLLPPPAGFNDEPPPDLEGMYIDDPCKLRKY